MSTLAVRDAATRDARRTLGRSAHHRLLVGALAVLALGLAVARALLGDMVIPVADAVVILRGEVIPGASFILMESSLPRAVLGLLAGAAFGAAGATSQTVLRNPLASPDIVGVGMGASAAAVVGIVVLGVSGPALSLLAVAGALVVAVLVRVVAQSTGERLVLVGVGVSSVLSSVVHYLFTRADEHDTQLVLRWLTGSLGQADWSTIRWLAMTSVAAYVLLWLASRDLPALQLGDDLALGLGGRRHAADLLLAVAVVVLALAVAAVGPMAFVAFLAGPIARALDRGRPTIVGAALVGAVVVVAADLVGGHVIPDVHLPAGVVTGLTGAPVLLWLLTRGRTEGSIR